MKQLRNIVRALMLIAFALCISGTASAQKFASLASKADECRKNGDVSGFLKNYEKAIQSTNLLQEKANGYRVLGDYYKSVGNRQNAIDCYKKSIDFVENDDILIELGEMYRMNRDVPSAVKCFKTVIENGKSVGYLEMGQTYQADGDFSEARIWYNKYVATLPAELVKEECFLLGMTYDPYLPDAKYGNVIAYTVDNFNGISQINKAKWLYTANAPYDAKDDRLSIHSCNDMKVVKLRSLVTVPFDGYITLTKRVNYNWEAHAYLLQNAFYFDGGLCSFGYSKKTSDNDNTKYPDGQYLHVIKRNPATGSTYLGGKVESINFDEIYKNQRGHFVESFVFDKANGKLSVLVNGNVNKELPLRDFIRNSNSMNFSYVVFGMNEGYWRGGGAHNATVDLDYFYLFSRDGKPQRKGNAEESMYWYIKALEGGNVDAYRPLATLLSKEGRGKEGCDLYAKVYGKEQSKEKKIQLSLSLAHLNKDVGENAKAVKWMETAYENGLHEAYDSLALMYGYRRFAAVFDASGKAVVITKKGDALSVDRAMHSHGIADLAGDEKSLSNEFDRLIAVMDKHRSNSLEVNKKCLHDIAAATKKADVYMGGAHESEWKSRVKALNNHEVNIVCSSCNGNGGQYMITCPKCKGETRYFCSYSTYSGKCVRGRFEYDNGYNTKCVRCDGTGIVQCNECAGHGKVARWCSKCKGNGSVKVLFKDLYK